MDFNEYKELLGNIIKTKEDSESKLAIAYAREHAEFKIGDIIKDCVKTILITHIYTSRDSERAEPFAEYEGPELTLKLVEKKKQVRGYISQNHNENCIVELVKRGVDNV